MSRYATSSSTFPNPIWHLPADNVGVVALAAATVDNAAVNVTASSITCTTCVLGTGGRHRRQTNVTISARPANFTSTAASTWESSVPLMAERDDFCCSRQHHVDLGRQRGGPRSGVRPHVCRCKRRGGLRRGATAAAWNNVTISVVLANVMDRGLACRYPRRRMRWSRDLDKRPSRTVFASLAGVTSTAGNCAAFLAGSCANSLTWTNVTISAGRTSANYHK